MMQGISNHILTPDTQAVLLLCGRFGKSSSGNGAKPLTNTEYARLAAWMFGRDLRPADMLHEDGRDLDDSPVDGARISDLLKRSAALALSVESWAGKGLWVISRGDAEYPPRLKNLKHLAPPILYGAGNASLLTDGGMAVVGSRDVDEEALEFTRKVSHSCAGQSIQIVSGGARGVDSAAMLAALESGGNVVGILADSLARAAVAGKYRDALEDGRLALVSPYDPASGFNVGHAMQRNEHIYALADHSLVVNSAVGKGGTWAGATSALKKGREVFVRSHGDVPEGNHELARLGAYPFPEEPWWNLREKLSRGTSRYASGDPESTSQSAEPNHLDETDFASQRAESGHSGETTGSDPHRPESDHRSETDYESVLPRLMDCLDEPRTGKDVAELLEAPLRQTQKWLKKAVEEGKVEKRKKPVRYARADTLTSSNSLNLFSSLDGTVE